MLKFSKYEVLQWVVFVNNNTEILDDIYRQEEFLENAII